MNFQQLRSVREAVRFHLERAGYAVRAAGTMAAPLAALEEGARAPEHPRVPERRAPQHDRVAPGDREHARRDGAVALVDDISLPLLKGSEIDFADELAAAEFRVKNPNAKSSCGCGVSFSI